MNEEKKEVGEIGRSYVSSVNQVELAHVAWRWRVFEFRRHEIKSGICKLCTKRKNNQNFMSQKKTYNHSNNKEETNVYRNELSFGMHDTSVLNRLLIVVKAQQEKKPNKPN